MTTDEHVHRILGHVFREIGVETGPGYPFYDVLAEELFWMIDEAIADGVEDRLREADDK